MPRPVSLLEEVGAWVVVEAFGAGSPSWHMSVFKQIYVKVKSGY